MPEVQDEELVVDLPSEGNDVSVEVSSDDHVIAAGLGAQPQGDDDSGEHAEYGQKVKRRIDKLTKKSGKLRGSRKPPWLMPRMSRQRIVPSSPEFRAWMRAMLMSMETV